MKRPRQSAGQTWYCAAAAAAAGFGVHKRPEGRSTGQPIRDGELSSSQATASHVAFQASVMNET